MKKDVRLLKSIIIMLIAVFLATGGIHLYINSIFDSLWFHTVSQILEVTSQGSHAFEVYIEKDMQILDKMIRHLSDTDANDRKAIKKSIRTFEDAKLGFCVIDLAHGIVYDGERSVRKLSAQEKRMYASFAEQSVREPYKKTDTGQQLIGGYKRFQFADGADGMVLLERSLSQVEEEFMLSFYDNAGFSYIINENGDILARSSHKDEDTFLNIRDAVSYDGCNVENGFSSISKNEQEGALRLTFDGTEYVFAFSPIDGAEQWYLLAVIPNAVIMEHAEQILKKSQTFLILFVCVVFVAGLFSYNRRRSHRQIRKREDDVRYRELLFGILAQNTNDVFLMFTKDDYTVEYVSPNVERVLGISQEEIKENIKVLGIPNETKRMNEDMQAIKNLSIHHSVVREGERVHRKTGEARWFLDTVYKEAVNDSERYVAVFSDRTQERRNEQALREALEVAKSANESKSIFLSNMSHDIRTPMNAIVGFSTLLQRDADDAEKVREYTHKIMASSQHLLGLINDVLDMSKIESGKTTLNLSEISLAEMVEELGAMMQVQTKAKQQDFKIYVYDVCNEEVLGDQLRINQVLINLLSNAVKYTPDGGKIELSVRQLAHHSKNYARFQFVIKDNGIGMSPEYMETIFHPFSREMNQKTAGIQGTGLGMAITKNLVDLMGGTIKVESKEGQGSTFILNLDLRIKQQDADPDYWKKRGVFRLLVVDDDEDICLGIQKIMADTGVDTQYALGGQAAVAMAKQAKEQGAGYDMVILDWQMPDISGIETARRIRKIVPSDVPIMILTAYDIGRIEKEGAAAGVDGYLQKPFFLSNLKMTIDQLKRAGGTGMAAEEKPDGEEEASLAGLHILAAEDMELNAEILTELLKIAGAACECAVNGEEVLKKFAQSAPGQYDLILMDVQMPIMNGYEATRAIRTCAHPQAKTVPIIAMTANTFSEDVKDALNAGMNAHVGKPIDMEQLYEVISDTLAQAGH